MNNNINEVSDILKSIVYTGGGGTSKTLHSHRDCKRNVK